MHAPELVAEAPEFAPVRRWQRLAISFPVFVRGKDSNGKRFTELATALNVSAGGVLVAARKLPLCKRFSVEIPTPPGFVTPKLGRVFEADVVWIEPHSRFSLVGLRFENPITPPR